LHNEQLEMVQVRRMMEEDLDIVFETDFNSFRRAVVWREHPDLKTMSQAVIQLDGSLIYQSDSILDEALRIQYMEDEPQLTYSERQELQFRLKISSAGLMSSGKVPVQKDGLFTYFSPSGSQLVKRWFKSLRPFRNSIAAVQGKSGGWNYLKENGEFLFSSEAQELSDFQDGFGVVRKNGRCFIVDEMGHRASEIYDHISSFQEGYALVFQKGKYNFLDDTLELLFERWLYPYRSVGDFSLGRALTIRQRGAFNYVQPDGSFLFKDHEGKRHDLSLHTACRFDSGFALIMDYSARGGGSLKYNFVDPEGAFLCKKWFPYASSFWGGLALVSTGKYYNYITHTGRLLLENGYRSARDFRSGLAAVQKPQGMWTFINKRGEELNCLPFLNVTDFSNGRALGEMEDGWYLIDMKGNDVGGQVFSEVLDDPYKPLFYHKPYLRVSSKKLGNRSLRINWFGEVV